MNTITNPVKLISFLSLYISFVSCTSSNSDVSNYIAEHIKHGKGTVVSLTKATDFKWDKVYVCGPYMPPAEIDKILGLKFSYGHESAIQSTDYYALIVFLYNGVVVHHFDHPAWHGNMSNLEKQDGYSPDEAIFILDNDGILHHHLNQ